MAAVLDRAAFSAAGRSCSRQRRSTSRSSPGRTRKATPMLSRLSAAFLAACLAMPARAADLPTYAGTVVRVVDGDSVIVAVAAWANTPFDPISVRLDGIDTPESRKPPAKCKVEVALGKAASAYANLLLKPGDAVTLVYRRLDKYARVDGDLIMPDGRSFGSVMLASGKAFPYAGGTKRRYCP